MLPLLNKPTFLLSLFLFSISQQAKASATQSLCEMMASQQDLKMGKEQYMRHCMGCHGADAMGRGPAAQFLHPKPRNLVSGTYKFKSVTQGFLPTKADLLRILERGLPGSAMPSFKFLPTLQRSAIVNYVMSLNPEWKNQETVTIDVPYPPVALKKKATFLASALKGQKNFGELCATCHGDKGLGDGPASEGIFDSENEALKPANLRRPHLKSGSGSRDVYRTISTGIDGTPMPPFAEVLTPEKRWEVVAYVLFMRGQEAGLYDKELSLEKAVNSK